MKLELVSWSEEGLDVLRRANTAEMTAYLGGPESPAKLADRHARYLREQDMFQVRVDGEAAGVIGFWDVGEHYEAGWHVLPEFQGRGVAVAATRAVVDRARAAGAHPHLHAYPRVDNTASNAVCRKAGFTLLGEIDAEYPPGNPIRCNDWSVDLR
ncbi:MAG: GNAT family N-acetyltransferase [Nonomuraea sp.]|nr:GNAT family N-acetyltransferase [Nonomuraea sp.]